MGKGQRNEKRVAEIYEDAGYLTYRPETTQYGENDVFGLFDMLALEPGHGLRMVQVKSNAANGINQWCEDVHPFRITQGLSPEFVVVYDGIGGHDPTPWRCRLIVPMDGDDHMTLVDEREDDREPNGEGVREFLQIDAGVLEGWYQIHEQWPMYVDGDLRPVYVETVHVRSRDDDQFDVDHYGPEGIHLTKLTLTTKDVTETLGVDSPTIDPPEWADE